MFHVSSTLHRQSQNNFSFAKENRLVYKGAPNPAGRLRLGQRWLATQAFWEKMRTPRAAVRTWSKYTGLMLPFTLMGHVFDGIGKGFRAAQWTGMCAWEATKGVGQIVAAPPVMTFASRVRRIKKYLWDGSWSTLGTLIRTPIRMALSPKEMVAGVRHAVSSLPKRGRGYLDALFQRGDGFLNSLYLKAKGIMGNTREAITDVFSPITRPAKYIATPAAQTLGVYANAELQTGSAIHEAFTVKVRQGIQQIKDSPRRASEWLAQKMMYINALKDIKSKRKAVEAEHNRKKIESLVGRPVHEPMPQAA